MTKKNIKLKPCSMCKGEAELFFRQEYRLGFCATSIYFVECQNCGVRGKESESKEEAIAFWNKPPKIRK